MWESGPFKMNYYIKMNQTFKCSIWKQASRVFEYFNHSLTILYKKAMLFVFSAPLIIGKNILMIENLLCFEIIWDSENAV